MNSNLKKDILTLFGIIAIILSMIAMFIFVLYTLGSVNLNTKYKEYELQGVVLDVHEYYYTHGTQYSVQSDLLRDITILLENGKKVTIKQDNINSDIHKGNHVKIKYIEKYIFDKYISSEYVIIE